MNIIDAHNMNNLFELSGDGNTLLSVKDKSAIRVVVPEGVTSVSYCAFAYCNCLQSVVFPDSLVSIGDCAFHDCSMLRSIELSSNMTFIGNNAFYGCLSLESIDVAPDNKLFSSSDGVLYNKELTRMICFPSNHKDKDFFIPVSVKIIGTGAFSGRSSLKELYIPDSVTTIEAAAFYNNSSLNHIEIPDTITHIGEYAFYNCSSLQTVHIPSDVTSIEKATFYNCASLKSVIIPAGVKNIGIEAFRYCRCLQFVDIPASVECVDWLAFANCPSLKNVNVAVGNQKYTSVNGVLYDKDLTVIFHFPQNSDLKEITLHNSIVSIYHYAFCNCMRLQAIDIPERVTFIGANAFKCCRNLKSIIIRCRDIEALNVDKRAFNGVDFDECILSVRSELFTKYRNHPVFGKFSNIMAEDFV